jgi:hypothetical protein
VLEELRDRAVAPRPVAETAQLAPAPGVLPMPREEIAGIAERIAHEVAEKLVHDAIAAMSATSDQASRDAAQEVAKSAAREVLATWRAEAANTNEHAENAAMAAAERVAKTILVQAADEADATRRAAESTLDEKLREALSELSARPAGDPELAERVNALGDRVEGLSLDALGPAARNARKRSAPSRPPPSRLRKRRPCGGGRSGAHRARGFRRKRRRTAARARATRERSRGTGGPQHRQRAIDGSRHGAPFRRCACR